MNADDKIADGRDQALDGSQRGQQQEATEIALGWREIVDASSSVSSLGMTTSTNAPTHKDRVVNSGAMPEP